MNLDLHTSHLIIEDYYWALLPSSCLPACLEVIYYLSWAIYNCRLYGKKILSHHFCEMYAAHLDACKLGFWKWSQTSKVTLGNSSCLLADFLYSFRLLILIIFAFITLSTKLIFPLLCLSHSSTYPCEPCPWLLTFFMLNLSFCISLFVFLSINFLQEKPFSRPWQNVHTVIQKWDSHSCRLSSL